MELDRRGEGTLEVEGGQGTLEVGGAQGRTRYPRGRRYPRKEEQNETISCRRVYK